MNLYKNTDGALGQDIPLIDLSGWRFFNDKELDAIIARVVEEAIMNGIADDPPSVRIWHAHSGETEISVNFPLGENCFLYASISDLLREEVAFQCRENDGDPDEEAENMISLLTEIIGKIVEDREVLKAERLTSTEP